MATDLKMRANRQNSRASTGPVTRVGKAISSRNATSHGLLSARLILETEDATEFHILTDDIVTSLRPAGAIEHLLVERIAIAVWRQRRLVQAETAMIGLARQPLPVAQKVGKELGRDYSNAVKPEDLGPFDKDRIKFCQNALAEIEALEEIDPRSLAERAPTVHRQLLDDADDETPEAFLAEHEGGLTAYIAELMLWCRKELNAAESRPQLLAVAEQVRSKAILLDQDALDLLARYQTTLDNQLYKALRALREAQEWRLKTVEPLSADDGVPPSLVEAA